MLFLSVAAPNTTLKVLRAVLCVPNMDYSLRIVDSTPAFGFQHSLRRSPEGYETYTQGLLLGFSQMVFVARKPGFLAALSEEAVWQALKSTHYTTPLLRSWMPWLYKRLLGDVSRLMKCEGYGCSCGLLKITDAELDELVVHGLKTGALRIE